MSSGCGGWHPERRRRSQASLSSAAVLASLGLFQKSRPRHFGLTPLSGPLRSDHPHRRGTLSDLPWVVEPVDAPEALPGRLTVRGGDVFNAVPTGADADLLKPIPHDREELTCLPMLPAIHAAMSPGGRPSSVAFAAVQATPSTLRPRASIRVIVPPLVLSRRLVPSRGMASASLGGGMPLIQGCHGCLRWPRCPPEI